ncbi:methyl-accepting chemotaxis protein [Cytobacillus spongiae]|uniref:methyl-accepting chemotaxis protein n=1 Tax=Cytobacillus spongiae TaxID=2901381 RepID=UPI001F1E8AA5|nr:methyl-accepting chemotaxis protein [Cytobacillus spongiae]UII56873.1 methyl-accepting chemotaxis protein [Cytobacillus spongiae]
MTLTKLSTKFLLFITALMIIATSTLGSLSYLYAKKELVESGKLDLQHIVSASISTLELLNVEVENGAITLEEAQQKARELFLGPIITKDGSKVYDYKQSDYLYKENGYLVAYDSNFTAQLHPVIPIGENKKELTNESGRYIIQEVVEIAKKSAPADRFYDYGWKNPGETKESNKIIYMSYFEPWDWNIGLGAYEEEFYESLNQLQKMIVFTALIVTFLGLSIFYVGTRGRFKVLQLVTKASVEISEGLLAHKKLPESKDEIGQLAGAFNKMSFQLKEIIENMQTMSANVSQSVLELSALSEETSATSEEIGKAMGEITKGSVSQASDIELTSQKADDLIRAIQLMNLRNNEMLELTKHSTEAIELGKNQVVKLQKSNQQSIDANDQISVGITHLYSKIQDISNIVTTIDTISKQTNLLALNASIEAARAGEYGKGFSVVADEVRKLAEETNEATNDIQEMIISIEKDTEKTVLAMSSTVDISTQLNGAVADTETQFNHISRSMIQIVDSITVLTEEIQHVTSNSEVILQSIQSISAVSEETAASSEEVLASVDEQIQVIGTIASSAEALNHLSENLKQISGQFSTR